ncbi:hypothetical protein IW261DRAFT_1512884 [Armillaria novae-zelandiae]|uniref:Secreted protein n=1 Tax=Armillaria novae-zelandiae TaxID=153914 RepID=A0AA39NT62_9AGAR|nr:hypothetical protein IW261DRAFT_1512884 [Armillaria novae-zelandiae]
MLSYLSILLVSVQPAILECNLKHKWTLDQNDSNASGGIQKLTLAVCVCIRSSYVNPNLHDWIFSRRRSLTAH